jgi:adenylate cyclase
MRSNIGLRHVIKCNLAVVYREQDTIAKRVVGAAAVGLTRFEWERALAKPTSNLAAYEYVLRGRGELSHDTRDSNDEASELFQRAIDLDPNYADAYAAARSPTCDLPLLIRRLPNRLL